MSKVPPLQFRREDIPDLSSGEATDRLLRGLNEFGTAAGAALNKGLTFSANVKSFSKTFEVPADLDFDARPVKLKNELGGKPQFVMVTRLVEVESQGKEKPVVSGGIAWAVDKDLLVVHGLGNLSAGKKYRCTILVVEE